MLFSPPQTPDDILAHVVADKFHFELLDATECAVYVCVKIDDVPVINRAGYHNVVSVA
jgi:hypothetical protein